MRLNVLALCAACATLVCCGFSNAAIHVTLTNGSDTDSFSYSFGSFTNPIADSPLESGDSATLAYDDSGTSFPETYITFTGQVGDFRVTFSALTNFPGTVEEALITQTTITSHNLGTTAGTLTYRIDVDDFTLPGSDGSIMTLTNSISTTLLPANGSASIVSGIGADPIGPELFAIQTDPSSVSGATTAAAGPETFVVFSRGPSFDMGNQMTISLPSGSRATVTGTTIAHLPEATSVGVWGVALLICVVGGRRLKVGAKKRTSPN